MKQLNQLYKTIMCYRQQPYRMKLITIITEIGSWTKYFQLLSNIINYYYIVKSYGHIINTFIHV